MENAPQVTPEKAIKIRPTEELLWIDIKKAPRLLKSSFPVDTIGVALMDHDTFSGVHRNGMEFAIRIWGGQDQTVDTINGRTFSLPYPNCIFLREGPYHTTSYTSMRESFFIIYNPKLESAFLRAKIRIDDPPWDIKLTPTIRTLMHSLRKLFPIAQEPGIADRIDALALALIVECTLQQPGVPSEPTHAPLNQIPDLAQISHLLQLEYRKHVNFEEIAASFGMSRRTFFRRWRQAFSQPPNEYLREIRLNHAAGYLKNTTLSISEIADLVGFNSPTYFIRCFRSRYNKSPREFRLS